MLAFRVFPWRYVIGTGAAIPAYIVWFLFKLKFTFWSLLLFVLIAALFALPVFACAMFIHSRYYAAKVPLNQTGIVWKDAAFKAAWNGKKIPVETFYEAYMDQKIDIEGDLLDNFLYRRYEVVGMYLTIAIPSYIIPISYKRRRNVVLLKTPEIDHCMMSGHLSSTIIMLSANVLIISHWSSVICAMHYILPMTMRTHCAHIHHT